MTTLFQKSNSHTYKVVATRNSGRQMTYNFIDQIDLVDDVYVLIGRDQPDDGGTMEKRSFILNAKGHGELDVRQISSTRTMNTQTNGGYVENQMAEDEIPF